MLRLERAGREVKIPKEFKNRIVRIPQFGVDFAKTTKRIARACFYKGTKNYVCGYHSDRRSDTRQNSEDNQPCKIVGVPGKRAYGESKYPVVPTPGCFHCGCDEEEVLYEFVLWKEWDIEAMIGDVRVVEGFGPHRFDPRQRSLVVQNYKAATGIQLDDMYGPEPARMRQSIRRLVEWYQQEIKDTLELPLFLTSDDPAKPKVQEQEQEQDAEAAEE